MFSFKETKWVLGMGNKIIFWKDVWSWDQSVEISFTLFFRSNKHYVSIMDVYSFFHNNLLNWNLGFRRNLNDIKELNSDTVPQTYSRKRWRSHDKEQMSFDQFQVVEIT